MGTCIKRTGGCKVFFFYVLSISVCDRKKEKKKQFAGESVIDAEVPREYETQTGHRSIGAGTQSSTTYGRASLYFYYILFFFITVIIINTIVWTQLTN